jgi:hypothetical protein
MRAPGRHKQQEKDHLVPAEVEVEAEAQDVDLIPDSTQVVVVEGTTTDPDLKAQNLRSKVTFMTSPMSVILSSSSTRRSKYTTGRVDHSRSVPIILWMQ